MMAMNRRKTVVALIVAFLVVGGAEAAKISTFVSDVTRIAKARGVPLEKSAELLFEAGVTGFDCSYREPLLPRMARTVMKPVNLYGSIDFVNGDRGEAAGAEFLATARKYGVGRIMIIPNGFRAGAEEEATYALIRDGLRRFVPQVRAAGIVPMIEDYGGTNNICSYARYLKRMLDDVPGLDYALDTGNLYYAGRGEDILEMMRYAKGRIAHVHLKDQTHEDNRRYASLGLGAVPNAELVKTVSEWGYSGWYTLENPIDPDRLEDVRRQVGVVTYWTEEGGRRAAAAAKAKGVQPDYEPGVYANVRERAANTMKYAWMPNRLFEKIARGEMPVGALLGMSGVDKCDEAAMAGLDFVWIDMEHNAITLDGLLAMQRTLDWSGCASLVRVRCEDFNHVKPILDIGVDGIIFPQISGYEAAVRAVEACRYPQAGGKRGICVNRQAGYGRLGIWNYLRRSETWPMIVIELEDLGGLADLDRILALKDVDAIMIGSADLSCSTGGLRRRNADSFAAMIDEAAEKTRRAGKLFLALGDFASALRWRAGLFCACCNSSQWPKMYGQCSGRMLETEEEGSGK